MHIKSPYCDLPAAPDANVFHYLWDRADQASWPRDLTLYIEAKSGRKWTYQEFRERVWAGATALAAPISQGGLGIQAKDEVVAIISQNTVDFATLVHSLFVIATPFQLSIHAWPSPFEIESHLNLVKATRVFVNSHLLSLVLSVAEKVGLGLDRVYVLGEGNGGQQTFDDLIQNFQHRELQILSPRPATKDTIAYFVCSSGTSGSPKAVMVTHGNLIFAIQQRRGITHTAEEVSKTTKYGEAGTQLVALPMFHSSGLQLVCLSPFHAPGEYVIMAEWDLEEVLRAISKYKVTCVVLTPALIHQIAYYPHIADHDLSSLICVFSGGSHLAPETAAKLRSIAPTHMVLREFYGLTEATVGVIEPPPGLARVFDNKRQHDPLVLGTLALGIQARILRADGSEADFNEAGELWIKGGGVTLGYFKDEEATRGTFIDGWVRTGDRFMVDEDSFFSFVDRVKDTIQVSSTEQVSPTQLENFCLSEPQKLISDIAVAGVNEQRGVDLQVPRAWIVLSDEGRKLGADATIQILEKWTKQSLDPSKWLSGGIAVVDQLPKSHVGKILRRVLQERYNQLLL